MGSKSKVYFYVDNITLRLTRRKVLKATVEALFKNEGKNLNRMTYIFCTDRKLREINRQFLNHDYFTDIITFDLSQDTKSIQGESYISLARVKENSLELNKPFQEELWRVIFHGALHLCGYSDKSEKKVLQMRRRENLYILRMK